MLSFWISPSPPLQQRGTCMFPLCTGAFRCDFTRDLFLAISATELRLAGCLEWFCCKFALFAAQLTDHLRCGFLELHTAPTHWVDSEGLRFSHADKIGPQWNPSCISIFSNLAVLAELLRNLQRLPLVPPTPPS